MNVPESKKHIEEDIRERSKEAWGYVYPVRNQNYVVMSMMESEKNETSAIKKFGVFSGLEEANKVSAEISKENDFFNVYVADTNAWIPVPATREFIENVEYEEQRITDIKNYFTALKERDAKNVISSVKKDKEKEDKGVEQYVEGEDQN